MHQLYKDNGAEAKAVTVVISFLIVLAVSVLIYYNIMASIDTTTLDANINAAMGYTTDQLANTSMAANATDNIMDQAGTFYQVAPILAIVIIAVIIIAYVKKV